MPRIYEAYQRLLESGAQGDFPNLLGNRLYKKQLEYFRRVPGTWNSWCFIDPNLQDFKANDRIVLGEFEDLEEVMAGQQANDSALGEHKWTNQLTTYERAFSIDRQTLINDDLRAMLAVPQKFGRAGARTIAKATVAIIENNTRTCHDGTVIFHSTHGNLGSTSLTLNETGANAVLTAINAILLQTDYHSGEIIGLTPKYLVVPPALSGIANALMESEQVPNAAGTALTANVVKGKLEVKVDPFLTSTTAWYVFADPADIPVVEVGFLRGVREPQLLTLAPTAINVNGGNDPYEFYFEKVNYKCRFDYGIGVGEWQGAYKQAP